MDPSYNSSFNASQNGAMFSQGSGDIVLQSQSKNKKKWWVIAIFGVVIVLALVGIFMTSKNKQQQRSTKDALLTYSNYLLYGEEKNAVIEEGDVWPLTFYNGKLEDKDVNYFVKAKELFNSFEDGFSKESRENKTEDELQRYTLIDNLVITNKEYLELALSYIETGQLYSEDQSEETIDASAKQELLYHIKFGIIDGSEWIYSEYMELHNDN